MFRNTGANAFAKNQTRLAYEDKRDFFFENEGFGILNFTSWAFFMLPLYNYIYRFSGFRFASPLLSFTHLVWWQNGDLGLVAIGWVLEYIQRFIVDSGRWDPTDHKSD